MAVIKKSHVIAAIAPITVKAYHEDTVIEPKPGSWAEGFV